MKKLLSVILCTVIALMSSLNVCVCAYAQSGIYTKNIKSVSFEAALPKRIIQYTCGWGDFDDSYEYNYPHGNSDFDEGDKITVTYEDNSDEEFIYTATDNGNWHEFLNKDNDKLFGDKYWYSINHIGNFAGTGTAYYSVTIKSREDGDFEINTNQIPVEIVKNSITKAVFTAAEPIKIVEKTNCSYDEEENLCYYDFKGFSNGDKITLYYNDLTNEELICCVDDEGYSFYNSKGDEIIISYYDISVSSAGCAGTGNITFKCKLNNLGITVDVPAEIIESPVKSVSMSASKIKYSTLLTENILNCSAEDFGGLYDMTVNYKNDTKKVFENVSPGDYVDGIMLHSSEATNSGHYYKGMNTLDIEYAGAKTQAEFFISDSVTLKSYSVKQKGRIENGFISKEDGNRQAVYWRTFMNKNVEFTLEFSDGTVSVCSPAKLGFWDSDPPEGTFTLEGAYSVIGIFGTNSHYASNGNKLFINLYDITKTLTVMDDASHIHTFVLSSETPATCTAYGCKTYKCSCGEIKTEVIKATGHKPVKVKAIAPTFKKAGKTDGRKCSVCGAVIVKQKTVAKLSSPKLSKLTADEKAFKSSWKSVKSVGGYQIQYSLKKNMKKSKIKTVKGAKKSELGVNKLKKGKTYYVRIRAYKKINGKVLYSKWSAIKKVKTV